jgi:hypothetical protein
VTTRRWRDKRSLTGRTQKQQGGRVASSRTVSHPYPSRGKNHEGKPAAVGLGARWLHRSHRGRTRVNERGRIVVDRHRQTEQRGSNVYQQWSDVVAQRFFLAKVARGVSFCAEHGAFLARRVLNASFNHRHHYQPSVLFFHDVHGFQSRQIGSSPSARLALPVSFLRTYAVRVEWSRLALASFPLSAFGAPFASSYHRPPSFPRPLIRTQEETCLSLHPAMGCRDRSWRLRALGFQHVVARPEIPPSPRSPSFTATFPILSLALSSFVVSDRPSHSGAPHWLSFHR